MHLFVFAWALTSAQAAKILPVASFESISPSTPPCDLSLFYWMTGGATGDFSIIGYNGELAEGLPVNTAPSSAVAELECNTGGSHFTMMLDPQLRLTLGPVPLPLIPHAEDGLIPEPATLALMAAGVLALFAVKRLVMR